MLQIANRVLQEGYVVLSEAYKLAFPHHSYKADIARQRLLQMPLTSIRIGSPSSGTALWFLVEFVEGVDYIIFC